MIVSHIKYDQSKKLWHLVINESPIMNDLYGCIIDIFCKRIEEVLDIIKRVEEPEDETHLYLAK